MNFHRTNKTDRTEAKAAAQARFGASANHDHDVNRCPCTHCDHDRDVMWERGRDEQLRRDRDLDYRQHRDIQKDPQRPARSK